jgi:hypothetical protein
LFSPWKRQPDRLLFIYWIASSIQLVGLGKVGSNHNYFIEFAAATAMLGAIGAFRLLHADRWELAIGSAACLIVVFGAVLGHGLIQTAFGGRGTIRAMVTKVSDDSAMIKAGAHDSEFQRLIQRVRDEPGIVIADPPDVVVLADRPVYLEPLMYSVLMAEGEWQPGPAVNTICTGQVTLLVLAYQLGDHSDIYGSFDAFPDPVTRALEKVMRYDETQAYRNVYTLRSGIDATGDPSTGVC